MSIGIAVIAVSVMAAISFQVRELAAALLIFSVVFGAIGIVILVLTLAEGVALQGIGRIAEALAHVRDWRNVLRSTLASAHHLRRFTR